MKEHSSIPKGSVSLNKELDTLFLVMLLSALGVLLLSIYFGYIIAPMGRDFENYESFYTSLSSSYGGIDSGERFEPGFKFLSYLISLVFPGNTKLYFSILVFISLLSKFILIYKYTRGNVKRIILFSILYVSSFILVFEVNQIREAIAISFGFLSFYYYNRGKNFITLVCLLLAFSFHYTSIIYGIGLFSLHFIKKGSINFVFIVITGFTILSKFAIAIFESINPIAAQYKLNYDGVTFGLTNITFLLALFFFIFHFLNLKKETPINQALLMFLYFGILFYIIINDVPVYQIRILELTEVGCLIIGIDRKFNSYYDYGSVILLMMVIMHKFIAYTIVNPLFG